MLLGGSAPAGEPADDAPVVPFAHLLSEALAPQAVDRSREVVDRSLDAADYAIDATDSALGAGPRPDDVVAAEPDASGSAAAGAHAAPALHAEPPLPSEPEPTVEREPRPAPEPAGDGRHPDLQDASERAATDEPELPAASRAGLPPADGASRAIAPPAAGGAPPPAGGAVPRADAHAGLPETAEGTPRAPGAEAASPPSQPGQPAPSRAVASGPPADAAPPAAPFEHHAVAAEAPEELARTTDQPAADQATAPAAARVASHDVVRRVLRAEVDADAETSRLAAEPSEGEPEGEAVTDYRRSISLRTPEGPPAPAGPPGSAPGQSAEGRSAVGQPAAPPPADASSPTPASFELPRAEDGLDPVPDGLEAGTVVEAEPTPEADRTLLHADTRLAPDAAAAPRAQAAPASRAAFADVWLRQLLTNVPKAMGAAQSLQIALPEGDGTMTLYTRREDDTVAVALHFSDPRLRGLAVAHAERLQEALRTHYGSDVDLSLLNDSASGSSQGGEHRDARRPASAGTPAVPPDAAPTARAAAPAVRHGGRREWIG